MRTDRCSDVVNRDWANTALVEIARDHCRDQPALQPRPVQACMSPSCDVASCGSGACGGTMTVVGNPTKMSREKFPLSRPSYAANMKWLPAPGVMSARTFRSENDGAL